MRGSIKKLDDKKYRVVADIGRDPVTNKRKQKVVTVTGSKKDAEKVLAATDGKAVTGPPKTDSSNRIVFLDSGTLEVLKAHRTAQLEQRLQSNSWQDHNLVFCRKDGGAINYRICNYFLQAQNLVPRISVHSLRHSHATFLLGQNIPERVIADRVGHTPGRGQGIYKMTAHYSHVTDDTRKEAAKAFARALQKGFSECFGRVGQAGKGD